MVGGSMSGINQNDMDIEIIKALGDEARIDILNIIGKKELNASDIAARCTLSRPTVSHHLQILKRARILEARKEGKEIYYSVNMHTLKSLSQALLKFIGMGFF
ncbi:MAG TPA: transcriptional regulator [Clostridiales bacterium]|nr:transcriptional regulator [Clostridiales bacterium]